ncbi:MAG TPA: hypothetical protein VLX28_21750 [Thermoanaerobaculia bacterium]|nr:hypothetical protein [Thermoanaerobaculia bacterium]
MSFDQGTKLAITTYIQAHLPGGAWYEQYFDFVSDADLAARLAEEFQAARAIYKIFRGLDAVDWWQRAQVRIQVLQYASIYEAVIHHVLFDRLGTTDEVRRLVEFPRLVRISVPREMQAQLDRALNHDGKVIIPTYQGTGRLDEPKVRFDEKVSCAVALDLIEQSLGDELIAIYEARNAIHLQAELRKNLRYEIDLARTAYRRLAPFRSQIVTALAARGLLLSTVKAETDLEDE